MQPLVSPLQLAVCSGALSVAVRLSVCPVSQFSDRILSCMADSSSELLDCGVFDCVRMFVITVITWRTRC